MPPKARSASYPGSRRRRVGDKSTLELCKQLSRSPSLAAAARLQRLQDADEVFVADPFKLSDGQAGRLLVRLSGHLLDQSLVEVDDVSKFGPRPFEAGAELSEEMAHAGFAARDAVRLKQTHLRPTQAKGIADHIIQRLDIADIVLDQPERLAPQRFEQPIPDESLDLARDDHALHADGVKNRAGAVDGRRRRRLAANDLHQREEVDRIVWMGDKQPLGVGEPRLKFRGQKAGSRGADQRLRGACGVDLGEHMALEIETLGYALLHPFGARYGVAEA